jgi:hypothetical protein
MVKFDPINEYVKPDSAEFRASKTRWVRSWTLSFGLAGAAALGFVMALGAIAGMGVLEGASTDVQIVATFFAGFIMGFVPASMVGALLGLLTHPNGE